MGTTELAQTLFGGSGDTVPLPQSTSTIYATAVADSENGSVKVVMDGQSITQPSGEETTVTLNADDFSDGVAELPLPAYAGTVSVIDSDGTYLLEDEFQVDGRYLTINALSGAKAVEVDYPANITLALRNTDFSPADDTAQLPVKPKGAVTLKLDGETVPNTVDGTSIKAEGVAAKQDASFTISYTRTVSAATTFEDGIYQMADSPSTITLTGITLSEDADPVETNITGYELDDNIVTLTDTTPYDQYRVEYTLSETVTLNYSDTVPESTLEDTEEETEEAEQEATENAGKVELNCQPTTVTVTCDGEPYADFTLETNVVSLNWRPDPVLVYTVEYEADVSLDLSSDDFANGQYKLPYIPTGTIETKVDGETVPNTVSEYMLEIPSLIVEIPSYTVTYQSEVANGEVEIPTSPSVRAGEAVQVSVINGTPVATAVIGEGDIQNANIQIAEDNSELAKTLASEADAIAKATNQHFWDDNDGAHVTEVTQEEWKAATEKKGANSLWNSLGMLFRKGMRNLMALVVDDPDDEILGTTGVAIYDGQGNNPENIVASFTESAAQIGADESPHMVIDSAGVHGIGDNYANVFDLAMDGSAITADYRADIPKRRGDYTLLGKGTEEPCLDETGYILGASGTVKWNNGSGGGTSNGRRFELIYDRHCFDTSATTYSGDLAAFTTENIMYVWPLLTAFDSSTDASWEGSLSGGIQDGTTFTLRMLTEYTAAKRSIRMRLWLDGIDYLSATKFRFAAYYTATTLAPSFSLGTRGDGDKGDFSATIGEGLIADGGTQTAIGKYNASDTTSALIIGNGTSDTSRSNALTVDWSGNVVTAGGVTASGGITTTGGASIVKDSRLDRDGTAPSSSQYSYVLGVTDKDSELVAYLQGIQYSTGATGAAIYAVNEKSDGTQVYNVIVIQTAKDGTQTYSVSNPANFRSAIASASLAANTFSGAQTVNGNQIVGKSTNLTSNTTPSSATNGNGTFRLADSANNTIGYICPHFGADNIQWFTMYAQREVGGAAKFSTLRLGIDSSGNARVALEGTNAQDAWLAALGFSPIYYRDGTGFSDVFTAASGFTVDTGNFRYFQRGKFATVMIAVKNTSALTAGTFYTIGTLASGRRPYAQAPLTDTALDTVAMAGIVYGSGIVSVRPRGNVPANSSIVVGGTIILA